MSKKQTFRVTFGEWVLYEDTVEAASPAAAARKVRALFLAEGPEHFKIRDNGTECWAAEAEDGTWTEVSDDKLVKA